jgi:hypothetical protein
LSQKSQNSLVADVLHEEDIAPLTIAIDTTGKGPGMLLYVARPPKLVESRLVWCDQLQEVCILLLGRPVIIIALGVFAIRWRKRCRIARSSFSTLLSAEGCFVALFAINQKTCLVHAQTDGNLSYLSLHLSVIGVGATKRLMSEEVPELGSARLSTRHDCMVHALPWSLIGHRAPTVLFVLLRVAYFFCG